MQGSVTLAGNDLRLRPDVPLFGAARGRVAVVDRQPGEPFGGGELPDHADDKAAGEDPRSAGVVHDHRGPAVDDRLRLPAVADRIIRRRREQALEHLHAELLAAAGSAVLAHPLQEPGQAGRVIARIAQLPDLDEEKAWLTAACARLSAARVESHGDLLDRARMQRSWADKGVRNARRKATDNDKHIKHFRGEASEKQAAKARQTDRMISRLSDLLRLTFDRTGAPRVALQEELEFLQKYLEIEQTRFQDRLSFKGYRSGHMMYLRAEDLATSNEDIRQFIAGTLPRPGQPARR